MPEQPNQTPPCQYQRTMERLQGHPVRRDVSSLAFLIVTVAILTPAYILGYNVVYTEGEVIQWIYFMLLVLAAVGALTAFYRRSIGIIAVSLLGGLLLCWQAYQSRKWAMIHEDICAIVTAAMKQHKSTGTYPTRIDELQFRHAFVRDHIHAFTSDGAGFRIIYFINQPGIAYSYSSTDGFSYYPD